MNWPTSVDIKYLQTTSVNCVSTRLEYVSKIVEMKYLPLENNHLSNNGGLKFLIQVFYSLSSSTIKILPT